ncbi:hypothetical protein WMY93_030684 [Mugilogobius chulae]|uniref:C-type lectin domain-containing protein n=1 Tax=Mugilogobius chulae TaxID=88201 RepID=A0AAW0MHU1_9GOBI
MVLDTFAETWDTELKIGTVPVRNQTDAKGVCGSDSECPVSGAWIGLHRPGTTRVWHWSQPALEYQENEQVWYKFIDKQPNFPADDYRESCALVWNNKWYDENCDSTLYFVCYNSEAMFVNWGSHAEKYFKLGGVSSEILRLLLEWMYTKCAGFLSVDNIQDVILAADMLMLEDLVKIAFDFMESHMDSFISSERTNST